MRNRTGWCGGDQGMLRVLGGFGLDRLTGGFDQDDGFLDPRGRGWFGGLRFGVAGAAVLLDLVQAAFGLEGFAAEANGTATET
jgi:hypothetical protein